MAKKLHPRKEVSLAKQAEIKRRFAHWMQNRGLGLELSFGEFKVWYPSSHSGVIKMELSIPYDSASRTFRVACLDKAGQPCPLPSPPVWANASTPALLTLTPAADGMSCGIVPVGPQGTETLTVTATLADNSTLTASSSVVVGLGTPSSLVMSVDPITPAAAPPAATGESAVAAAPGATS